jgi:hypothetical protein
MNRVLFDSSFLFSLFDTTDKNHVRSVEIIRIPTFIPLIPDVVLPEVTYLVKRKGGIHALERFIALLINSQATVECLAESDLVRAREVLLTYRDANLDFVDCCITAQSERLNIHHIATFDRRDFSIIRPRHVDYFTLLP